MKAFSLEGHAALVTGSSQGIGLAMGKALQEAGAKVVFHGLPDAVEGLSAYVKADLMEIEGPQKLVEAAFALEPGLDTLICNAGSF
uniref:SDR family NAD(P)-dependent oxidoreductase n=1 Tax=Prosthecobacter sp. TaxID=1965333 RepID=UPI003784CD7D